MVPPVLTLASRSPQRRAILEQLGIEFSVRAPEVEELSEGAPREIALENARRKARAVEGELVLGVDTVVALEDRPFGKPSDGSEAETFLRALSGREHQVWSGICLRTERTERTGAAMTKVRFKEITDDLLDWYLTSGEWQERAGGYAIQGKGAALIDHIEGDYTNVVGLPVVELLRLEPALLSSKH